jgi:hypothetical protein
MDSWRFEYELNAMHTDSHIFAVVPIEACSDTRLKITDLRVLLALFSFRNKNTNLCCPKRSAVAERCGLTENQVSKATADLVRFGWLEKTGRGGAGMSCQYVITVPDLTPPSDPNGASSGTVPDTENGAHSGMVTDSDNGAQSGTVPDPGNGAQSGTVPDPGNGARAGTVPEQERFPNRNENGACTGTKRCLNRNLLKRKEQTSNRQGNINSSRARATKKAAAFDPSLMSLPDVVPHDAWIEFIQHRKSIGKPLTELAATKCIATLQRLAAQGEDIRACIDQSIERSYTGIFGTRHERSKRGHYDAYADREIPAF